MPISIIFRPMVPLFAGFLLLSGCTGKAKPVELTFAVRYGNEAVSCTAAADGVTLTDLRFYIHDLALIEQQSGHPVPLDLDHDGIWQGGRIALLDFENGEGTCVNGSPPLNTSVRGVIHGGPFRGLTFTVGVPENLNHRDPLIAKAPLNLTAMHWHWLAGYKFLRAGVATHSDSVWLHLGSSHCDGSIGDGIHCRSANRVAVNIADFDAERDQVVVDLKALFEAIDLADDTPSDCSSGPGEVACKQPFRALGLAFEDESVAPSQKVFRSEPGQ